MFKATADLCDEFIDQIHVCDSIFQSFGKKSAFEGRATTIKLYEDNTLVRTALESSSKGGVLVVDGGGSLRCALVGDRLAQLAIDNGWSGIIVYGCIRDSAVINEMEIGIKAMNTTPRKSIKRGDGQRDIAVSFAGVTIKPGDYIYSDNDGIVVADRPLGDQNK